MTGFYITDFAGMQPRRSARLLENNQAQNAVAANLLSGELEAFKDLSTVVTPSKAGTKQSIYRYGQDVANEAQYWFHWTADVDVVRGPVNNDTSERTYWTGEAAPRMTESAIALTGGTDYPMNWYTLGVPKPAAAPTASTAGGGSGDNKSIAFVYTYVSAYGEEGPPSDPSDILTMKDGDSITIASMSTGPGAGYNITAKRIYAAVTGSTGTDYQYLTEIAVASASTTGAVTLSALAEVLPSRYWTPPPSGLLGLRNVGAGILAGFLNNDVWLSEPYRPHAWPTRYRKSTPFGVVALGGTDGFLAVLTKGTPYVDAVNDPASVTLQPVGDGRACVAKRGVVTFPGAVVYPCAEGLGMVSLSGWTLVSDAFFTRKQWQALDPTSISAWRYGNRYVGFYDDGTTQRGFLFNPSDPRASLVYLDFYATAGFNDPLRDALYLQVGDDIQKWDASASLRSYTWKSKVFTMPRPICPQFAQVVATSYPVTFKLYADGSLLHTETVQSREPFILPGEDQATDFEVQLEGTANVRGVAVVETIADLAQLVT